MQFGELDSIPSQTLELGLGSGAAIGRECFFGVIKSQKLVCMNVAIPNGISS